MTNMPEGFGSSHIPGGGPPPEPPKDTAPKKGGAKAKKDEPSKPKAKSTAPRGRPVALEKQLTELFEGIGVMAMMVNPADGQVILDRAPQLGSAWYKVCQKDARVRKFFEGLLKSNAWGEAVFATAMVAMPIAQNHGLIPEGIPLPSFSPDGD